MHRPPCACTAAIVAAVADPARPAADRARDAERKPAEVVAFAGIKPGDRVADLMPGVGYFTRIFSKVVGPQGRVHAIVSPRAAQRPGGMDGIKAVGAAYPNVSVMIADPTGFAVANVGIEIKTLPVSGRLSPSSRYCG